MKYNLISRNTKLAKSDKIFSDVITSGLSLAPHRRSGYNVCENAGFCSALCVLWFSGRTVTGSVRAAMERRTKLLFEDRPEFDRQLHSDLDRFQAYADRHELRPFFRPDVASDLGFVELADRYPRMQFYGYSKIKSRVSAYASGKLPPNYHITASWHERMSIQQAHAWLHRGVNLAVVFDTAYHPQSGRIDPLPASWRGWPVIDGDIHDLRHPEFDGRGHVIGLRFKGSRKLMSEGIKRGFVVSADSRVCGAA